MIKDTYLTITKSSRGLFKDKGSRFISFAEPVTTTDDVKSVLDSLRKEYHDARHHCYAYLIGYDMSRWRTNDDGEPSGSAGKPILGQIKSAGLTNILIVVVRYFGGTLLGVSGLINAYKTSAADSINNAVIEEQIVRQYVRISFPYPSMNEVMRIIKDENIPQSEQLFELSCSVVAGLRLSSSDQLLRRFSAVDGVTVELLGIR